MNGMKILCIGMMVCDTTVTPIPDNLFSIDSTEIDPPVQSCGGDALNVAIAVARLACNVSICGKVGDDTNGTFLIEECRNSGVDVKGIRIDKEIALTVQLSKLRSFYFPDESGTVSFAQAFAMATLLPGVLFDRVGSLAPGYRFDALVIDGLEDGGLTRALTPSERLERFCYTGDDRNITERILGGTTLN